MPFPNLAGKQDAEPLVTPTEHSAYKHAEDESELERLPAAVVLCYSRTLMGYLTEHYDGQYVGNYYGDLYAFADANYAVGVLGNFGIGSPATAMLMDELVADGVEKFLSIGFAGCLDEGIEMGEFIVCDKAIRDEGTSHHYVESAMYAHASDALTDETIGVLRERDEPFHVGPSWTIDAMYRETKEEVQQYAGEGVLAVEMEASAVFAVARYRNVEAASMFVVSDYLGPSDWEPKFHRTREDMQHLGDTAKDVLAASLR